MVLFSLIKGMQEAIDEFVSSLQYLQKQIAASE
jgi:hypothetical protein